MKNFDLKDFYKKIDFGIITIREDEFTAVLKHFEPIAEHHGGTSYSEREKILIELKKLIENLSDVSQEMRSLIHQAKFLTARP